MLELPKEYKDNMKDLLKDEYADYIKSFDERSASAIRVNTLKTSVEGLWDYLDYQKYQFENVKWNKKGFYFDPRKIRMSKQPAYYAGLYYIQEPSAMIPAILLPVNPGDKVLDLCAAPGGKAGEILSKLAHTGLLVANDISASRARVLEKNLIYAGGRNFVVTAETPERLRNRLGEYFDCIMIDAPCSGEGMFRRDPKMIKDWVERGPEYYKNIQSQILDEAYHMLKPGGRMVYSTCTFSIIENEYQIRDFLNKYNDMSVSIHDDIKAVSNGIYRDDIPMEISDNAIRVFPHRARGEGHFAILLEKSGGKTINKSKDKINNKIKNKTDNTKIIPEIFMNLILDNSTISSDIFEDFRGLRVITGGIKADNGKKKFEPSTALSLSITSGQIQSNDFNLPYIVFQNDDERIVRYLKGETVFLSEDDIIENSEFLKSTDSFLLVTLNNNPLGWAKYSQNRLKNKYQQSWRWE